MRGKSLKTVLCSGVVAAAMIACSNARAADLLVDFNDRDQSTLTQSGWNAFELTSTNAAKSMTFGAYTVTVSDTGQPVLDDRVRTGPTGGSITMSNMLRDFIFGDNNDSGQGMSVLVEGLTPNKVYTGRIWSYDDTAATVLSGLTFLADWTANGTLIADDYNSGGSVPTTDNEKSFAFSIAADVDGKILFQALRTPESDGSAGVINGLELTAIPEPTTAAITLIGGLAMLGRLTRRQS